MRRAHKDALRLWLELARVALPMSREMDKMLRNRFGQSLVRFDLMSQLARYRDGLPVRRLAEQLLASTSGNISTLLDRMIADGIVERRPDSEDGRVTNVHLTGKGRALFDDMAVVHAGWIARELSAVPLVDQRDLADSLSRLHHLLDGAGSRGMASSSA